TLLALKKIQAKTVRPKVASIATNSLKEGRSFPAATISRFFLFVLNKTDGKINNAFKKPQMINVQLAPCQKPLIINMIKIFLTFIKFPTRLPPKGIYK